MPSAMSEIRTGDCCGNLLPRLWHEASVRTWVAWCWLASYRESYSGRTIPVSRFSLTTYDYDRPTCCYEVSRLFVGYRRSITSSQCFAHVNPPVLPFVLARKSQFAAVEAKLENRRRGPVRKTTIHQRFRSQSEWIVVSLGTAGYIPGKYILRVRGHLAC